MAKHAFFLNKGGSGGGGGTGGFALIKIEYPEGQEVTVTFNGETTTAPDTSGLWLYGCEETGTYTIAITGTTAEVEVEITTQGQIESVWISPQVINYALIYYLGNEFTNVDGTPEARYAISTGGLELYNKTYSSGVRIYSGYKTNLNINTNPFDYMFVKGTYYDYHTQGNNYKAFGTDYTGNTTNFMNNLMLQKVGSSSYNFEKVSVNKFNLPICFASASTNSNYVYVSYKKSNYIKTGVSTSDSRQGVNQMIFALGFCNTDDISGLSDYGNDIATILSNATDLFADTTALNWMCLNCTGDFMISALSNTNFINAMNSSPNKSILVANEHWNRFLALLSV